MEANLNVARKIEGGYSWRFALCSCLFVRGFLLGGKAVK